ncbi:hypothetical protein [Sinorhizobium medicae]|uniref:hypothetical protein n=1 Tax=Sinorhizobium medicae TaxID=110321 RepID=UPI00129606DA|nr:hypothetical protein [Sinorhizobium medicae]MQX45741.1 hypothetical protein [Sinorhizobium medicae]
MFRFFIVTAVAVLFGSAAQADWQYTRWGMTVDEVLVASKGKASKPKKPNTVEDGSILNLLSAPYNVNRLRSKAEFWFSEEDRRLSNVRLSLMKISQCPELRGALTNVYGPAEKSKTSLGEFLRWWDRENGNDILLMDYPGAICSLDYKPIRKPRTGGLWWQDD